VVLQRSKTPLPPSRSIRENPCSSVAKKTPLIRGPKPPVAPLAPNGGEGPGVRGQHHPHTTPPTTTPQLLRGFAASRLRVTPNSPQHHKANQPLRPLSPLFVDFVSFVDQTQPMRSIRENPCSSVEKKQPQHKIMRLHKQWRIRHLHNFFAPGLRPGVSEKTEDRGAE